MNNELLYYMHGISIMRACVCHNNMCVICITSTNLEGEILHLQFIKKCLTHEKYYT